MKLAGLCAIGIGAIVSAGPLSVTQGYAGEGTKKCTLGTLYGQYLVAGHGTLFGVAAGIFNVQEGSVSEAAGYSLYYGDGTGTDYVTFTINGVNQNVTSPTSFTYTLNSDCTGTRTVSSGPSLNIFAAFDGDGLSSIATTSGFAESDYERRTGSE
ncbi:MAG: hypothetical protein JO358_16445 [Alphaproteobacteria bacterium]|nr:hypothetical protein [Alphaproteobacteria bacterium]